MDPTFDRHRIAATESVMDLDSANAGKFKILVAAPYPAWCSIQYGGEEVCRVHHNELADLEYVLRRAMTIARQKLKSDARLTAGATA